MKLLSNLKPNQGNFKNIEPCDFLSPPNDDLCVLFILITLSVTHIMCLHIIIFLVVFDNALNPNEQLIFRCGTFSAHPWIKVRLIQCFAIGISGLY